MEKSSRSGGVQSLDRAFDLLELLCKSPNGMAIHQLSEITGLHKSTVHRLLAAMASRGYVRRDPESAVYRAGMRLCELSEYIQENLDVVARAREPMERLSRTTGETVHRGDGPPGSPRGGGDRLRLQGGEHPRGHPYGVPHRDAPPSVLHRSGQGHPGHPGG